MFFGLQSDECVSRKQQRKRATAVVSSPRSHCCLLLVPFVVVFLAVILSKHQSNTDSDNNSNDWNPHYLQRRRLDSDALPYSVNSNDSFHPNDHLFDIAPDQPLPPALIRRLVEMETSGPQKTLMTAPLYGSIFAYAYYFVSILVGSPPQRQSVIVDTGSSLLGFPCRECVHCGQSHIDRGFDFAKSTTARWLTCSEPQCVSRSCNNGDHCSYYQGYSEGSSIEGNYFSDYVALGEESGNNQFVRFDYIGCHEKETKLFVTQKASGILGVSYPKRGKQETLVDALFRAPGVDTKVFGFCASDEGGQITVGGFNSSVHRKSRTAGSATLRLLGISQLLRFDMKTREQVVKHDDRRMLKDEEPLSRLRHLLDEHVSRRRRLEEESPQMNNNNSSSNIENKVDSGMEVVNEDTEEIEMTEDGDTEEIDMPEDDDENAKMIETASASVAWTPISSSSSYHVDVLEVYALAQANGSDNFGERIASQDDLGRCAIDSGTTFSYLAPLAFSAFKKVLVNSCSTTTKDFCTNEKEGTCWTLDSHSQTEMLPSFLLKLKGGAVVEWTSDSYLSRRGQTNRWCASIDDNRQGSSVLGMSFMKNKNIIFDRERDLLGIVSANCPVVLDTSRPPPPPEAPPANPSLVGDASPILTNVTISEPGSSGFTKNDFEFISIPNHKMLWGSASLFMGVGLLAMAAIALKTFSSTTQDYDPMATADHLEEGATMTPKQRHIVDLEMSLPGVDEDQIGLTSPAGRRLDDETSEEEVYGQFDYNEGFDHR